MRPQDQILDFWHAADLNKDWDQSGNGRRRSYTIAASLTWVCLCPVRLLNLLFLQYMAQPYPLVASPSALGQIVTVPTIVEAPVKGQTENEHGFHTLDP